MRPLFPFLVGAPATARRVPVSHDALAQVLVLASDDGSGASLDSLPCFATSKEALEAHPAAALRAPPEQQQTQAPGRECDGGGRPAAAMGAGPLAGPHGGGPAAPAAAAAAAWVGGVAAAASTAAAAAGEGVTGGDAAAPGARRPVYRPMKFWSRRLWVFLSKVRELKSVPKDEKCLDSPDLVALWAA